MENLVNTIRTLLRGWGIDAAYARILSVVGTIAAVFLALWLLHQILRRLVEPLIKHITDRTETKLDDVLLDPRSMRWVWALVEGIIAYLTLPPLLKTYPTLQSVTIVVIQVALILSLMMLAIEMVKRLFVFFASKDEIDDIVADMQEAAAHGHAYTPQAKSSLRGLVQMIIVIIVGVSIVLVISVLFGKNPLIIFSGLGAMAAVLLLVFQDSILGVVAGVQITANKMLELEDWIIAPKFGANGRVIDISLAAVKVLNWDNSITTIPPYKLLTEGFQNWHNMQETMGRRVARSLNIDLTTVAFASDEQLARWSAEPWWRADVGQRVTNVTALRMYLEHYISHQPTRSADMLWMVRELQPTAEGLPVELYFFTTKVEWAAFEKLQADVIDHVIATIPEFGLALYQRPSGSISVTLDKA